MFRPPRFPLRLGRAGRRRLDFSQRGGRNRRRRLAFIVPLSRRENEERERLASPGNRREDDRSGSILAHSATPPLQQRARRGCQVCPAQFGKPIVAPVASRSEHGIGASDVCTRVDTGSFRSSIAMTPTAGSLRPVESRDVPRRIGPATACWSRSAKRRSCDSSAATPPSTPTASSGCGEFATRRPVFITAGPRGSCRRRFNLEPSARSGEARPGCSPRGRSSVRPVSPAPQWREQHRSQLFRLTLFACLRVPISPAPPYQTLPHVWQGLAGTRQATRREGRRLAWRRADIDGPGGGATLRREGVAPRFMIAAGPGSGG